MTMVTTVYRYKRRPQRKKAQAAEITVPVIVEAKKPGKRVVGSKRFTAQDIIDPATTIVTAAGKQRRSASGLGDAPALTPEEHQRRGEPSCWATS